MAEVTERSEHEVLVRYDLQIPDDYDTFTTAASVGAAVTQLLVDAAAELKVRPDLYVLWDTLRVARSPGPEPTVTYICVVELGDDTASGSG